MVEHPDLESLSTEVSWDSHSLRIHSLCSDAGASEGSPLVLVPGLGASGLSMLPTARLLAREHHVFVVDLPGHGDSERPRTALDLSGYAAIMAAWLEALNLGRAVWIGHSFGSQVLVELATQRPEIVDTLVLVSLTVDPQARTMVRQLARLFLDATREPPEVLRLLARDYRRTGLRTLLEIGRLAVRDRVEIQLPSITAPTLLVYGARDPLVPERWAHRTAELVPRAKLVPIPGATHALPYVSPVELAREVQRFLSELPGAPLIKSLATEQTNESPPPATSHRPSS
jgi:2-hydroxy-6-oxonona-2,4-dienedioate hydrolase